jgi:hypothetical protein
MSRQQGGPAGAPFLPPFLLVSDDFNTLAA